MPHNAATFGPFIVAHVKFGDDRMIIKQVDHWELMKQVKYFRT